MVDRAEEERSQKEVSHVRNPREGKTFSIGEMDITIKATGAETEGRFSIIEVTIPPYFADIVPHFHQTTAEAIYLTQGMLAVTLGDETIVVRQGSFILVPPKQIHRFWNPAATQATFVAIFSPPGAEGFLEALSGMRIEQDDQQPGTLAEIWALGMGYDHFLQQG